MQTGSAYERVISDRVLSYSRLTFYWAYLPRISTAIATCIPKRKTETGRPGRTAQANKVWSKSCHVRMKRRLHPCKARPELLAC